MRYVTVEHLEPGMVLARTIWGASGEVLLARGAVLQPPTIDALRRREVKAVWVRTGPEDDTTDEALEVVSPQLRQEAAARVAEVFRAASSGADPRALTRRAQQLSRIADSLVDEVLSGPVVGELVALKTHDAYTLHHSVEVAAGSVLLGLQIGVGRSGLRELALGGLLHDLGKIRIPQEVLNKPGPLSPDEWDLIKQHPTWGYELVARMGLDEVLPKHIAWQHHERQDGQGYPRGLRGTNRIRRHPSEMAAGDRISLCAEIAQVADVYSALRSDRPYRPGMPPEQAVRTMREMAGPHLNRELLDAFLAAVPTFPVGLTVRVHTGPFAGYLAVVVRNHRTAPDRPVIRLVRALSGTPCDPVELDLRTQPVEISSWIGGD
jgi:putative nucleotidyltransferase with HDIG domain